MSHKKTPFAPATGSARKRSQSKVRPERSSASFRAKAAFRVGDLIAEKVSGRAGRVTADLTEDLTYEPGSYECYLGHGYLVVRHRSEIEERPLARNDKHSEPAEGTRNDHEK